MSVSQFPCWNIPPGSERIKTKIYITTNQGKQHFNHLRKLCHSSISCREIEDIWTEMQSSEKNYKFYSEVLFASAV